MLGERSIIMTSTEIILLCVAIVFNATANILLKFGMFKAPKIVDIGLTGMFIHSLTNLYVWLGLISFGIAFVSYSIVLTKLKLSIAYPIMTSAGFAIVTVSAIFLFGEMLTWLKVLGILIIAAGIWVVSIAR
jgi:multidrug transporter EmrE-like cation transporter